MDQEFNQSGLYPQASATGVSASGAGGAAEGGPSVLAAPGVGLVGVPSGAEGADGHQVPVVLPRIVVVIGCSHDGLAAARWSRGGWAAPAVALAVLIRRAVVVGVPAPPVLAAAQPVRAYREPGLSAALLGPCATKVAG